MSSTFIPKKHMVHMALLHIQGRGDAHQGGCQENEKE